MNPTLPDPVLVLTAIDAYLDVAYDGAPPPAVIDRVAPVRAASARDIFDCPAFERQGEGAAARFRLRLGNRRYPFMKLIVEPRPDGLGYLFKADTHDTHVCPAEDSPEHGAFLDLMAFNRETAESIEAAWAKAGVPTFKAWLREDLERRKRAQGRPEARG